MIVMANGRPWTKEEVKLLKELYPALGIKETAERLNRSYFSVSIKANRLGISIPKETTSRILSTMPRKRAAEHFLWKGGISLAASRGFTDNEYKRFKNSIKQEMDYKCESCGGDFKKRKHYLDIHHKDGNKLNNSRSNIAVLCRKCHMRAERLLETSNKKVVSS